MTSIPASRSAAATTLAPRSWPSRPGFATRTRMGRVTGRKLVTARLPWLRSIDGFQREPAARCGTTAPAHYILADARANSELPVVDGGGGPDRRRGVRPSAPVALLLRLGAGDQRQSEH